MTAPGRAAPLPHHRSSGSYTRVALVLLVLTGAFASGVRTTAQSASAPASVRSPEDFFGFRMGAEGRLASWGDIDRYIRHLADTSPRVRLVSLGTTTEGRDYIAAVITAPRNMARLDEIQRVNLRLADPRALEPSEAAALLERQPAVVAIGASIHANEIGATQAMNELAYRLATADDGGTQAALDALVVVLVPSLNPDGHQKVIDWFAQTRGTPYENGPMPWLYHKYAGHDINRDAFMLNLAESRALAGFFYRVWHPQVFLTMHQMGAQGPRLFVPPNYDPIDANYDPLIWRTAGLLGHAMALQLERDDRAGVVQNAFFDYYWPGYEDSAPLGHNTVCLLTEAASSRLAAPIELRSGDLLGGGRGFSDHRPHVNYPNPWRGGVWRPRDIIDYELSAVSGLLEGAARYRKELLENFYAMGARAVASGRAGKPFAFVIPPAQHDPHAAATLVDLLIDGSVDVQRAIEPFRAGGRDYPAGTDLVLMAQPYRAYAKTLLETQQYPIRRVAASVPPERPYDVTGWTLPLQMHVAVDRIEDEFTLPALSRLDHAQVVPARVVGERKPAFYLLDVRGTGGILALNQILAAGVPAQWLTSAREAQGVLFPAGSLVLPATGDTGALVARIAREQGLPAAGLRGSLPREAVRVAAARIGLYKPWLDNIDEGWTRLLLERFGFTFVTLTNADIRAGHLRARVDAVILPDERPDRMVNGYPPGSVPEQYAGGLNRDGIASLVAFVKEGGTLVCLDESCAVPIEAFPLPIKDVLGDLVPDRFFCPGSIVRLKVDPTQPAGFGLPEDTAAFFSMSSAYAIDNASARGASNGAGAITVQPVAWYGADRVLLSGWLEGPDAIAHTVAAAEAHVGAGSVLLIGFRAQHRAQSYATFRLLFNALYLRPAPSASSPR